MSKDITNEVFNEVFSVFKKHGIEYGAVFYIHSGTDGVKEAVTVIEVNQDGEHKQIKKMVKHLHNESKLYFNLNENGEPKITSDK